MADIYNIDGHKLIWHLDRVSAWQEGKVIPPIYVEISPVSFCNHRCIFCGVDFAMQKLKLETVLLCERLKEMGRLGVRSVMFAGEGEPLLHPDLPLIVRTAKESGIDISITTNASLGNRHIWSEILPYLTWVKFSIDAGSADIYSAVRNVPEEVFDKTLQSIRESVQVKNERHLDVTMGVQFLLIDENKDDVRNALEIFSGLGIDYFVIKPYSLHPRMLNKKEMEYTRDMLDNLEQMADKYRDNHGMTIVFRKGAFETYMKGEKNFSNCNALPFWGHISANGDFYTCSVFLGDDRFRAGNIYTDNMQKIFYGPKRRCSIQYGRETLVIGSECRVNCRMARVNEFLDSLRNAPMHINFV